MNTEIKVITNYSNKSNEQVFKRLGDLAPNVISQNRVFYEADTNIFINDTCNPDNWSVDSFKFLYKLLPDPLPNVAQAGYLPKRNIEIWEGSYLTAELANLLLDLENLENRILVPISGCGEIVAMQLQQCLNREFGVKMRINDCANGKPAVVVDDVIKTGGTILNSLSEDIVARPDTVYASWAMPWVNAKDLVTERLDPLRKLTEQNQKIFAAVVYAGDRISSPLSLPVNSISTFQKDDKKSQEVLSDLSEKYFGDKIFLAFK